MKARFELINEGCLWFFHLRAPNAKIVLQSELYSCKRNALKGIEAIKRYANVEVKTL